ncbi:response regulator transcription factor [Streptomyces sp. NPDC002845]
MAPPCPRTRPAGSSTPSGTCPPPGESHQQPPRLDSLTQREREVLVAMARGWNNAEIADHLSLAPTTVKSHVSRILHKTGARDRLQAVVIALDAGLTAPSGLQPPDTPLQAPTRCAAPQRDESASQRSGQMSPKAEVSREVWRRQARALAGAL